MTLSRYSKRAIMGGTISLFVIMLYDTVVSIIKIVGLGHTDHPMAEDGDPEK